MTEGNRTPCGTARRRQLVASTTDGSGNPIVNGIDYVEVLDNQAPADSPRHLGRAIPQPQPQVQRHLVVP